MRIVFTGGGTAGHVVPFEPLIEQLRTAFLRERESLPKRLGPSELELMYAGVADEHTTQLFEMYDVPVIPISSGKIRRYVSSRTISDLLFRLPVGIVKALMVMWQIMPDVVIGKGGYGSVPVLLAAAWYRIPILLHESDVAPGFTNTAALRFASLITAGFPGTREHLKNLDYKVFVTGTPVRPDLRTIEMTAAKKRFQIESGERVLLVMGGSQGAQQINELLLKVLPAFIAQFTIMHITGEDNFSAVGTVARELIAHSPRQKAYRPFAYLTDKMAYAIAAADGVVSRAGASSLAEIAALRKPALLIPLDSSANDHQRKNARVFEAAGAAIVLDPTNLGENIFRQNVERLMADEEVRAAISANLAQLDFPQAAKDIADLVFKLARGFAPRRAKRAEIGK